MQVIDIDEQYLRVKYMKEVASQQYVWPDKEDIWMLPVEDVVAMLKCPTVLAASSSRIRYAFPNAVEL